MQGIVFFGDRKVEMRTFPDPTPWGKGETLIPTSVATCCAARSR